MGLNAVIVCNRHGKAVYCMRGEEGFELQRLMRTEHRDCMRGGKVVVYCDADVDHTLYDEFWPHEERPAVTGIRDPKWLGKEEL